jgi:type VI secretion system secreted protein Hcp
MAMPEVIDAEGGGGPIWNVEEKIGTGSTGDDVMLVQYLVARYGMWEGKPGYISVHDVDGIWGPKTAASFLLYEQSATSVVTNGFVYPVRPHTDFLHAGAHGFLHHIVSLQEYYCAIISGKPVGGVDSHIVMEMAHDGMCPSKLAYALSAAHAKGGHSHGHAAGGHSHAHAGGGGGGAGGGGQSDFFLKIDGVEGESQDDKHKNEIHITSFSIKATNAGSGHSGKGSGVGKTHIHDLDITKELDKASPNIFLNCLTGKHHPKATIVARKAGEKPHEYLKITLEEVFISDYQLNAKKDGETPVESFSLNFAAVEQEHKVQNADGSAGAANKKKFDLKKHKAA